ncbi:hypothetical protein [Mucilaginibacter sp. HD30]
MYQAGLNARVLYYSLKGDKGFLSIDQCDRYLELFDHYMSLCSEYDLMTEAFHSGAVGHHDEYEF